MNLSYTLTIILGVQLLAFHFLALTFYLYWAIWWFDIVMHILGGVWLVFVLRSLQLLRWRQVRYKKLSSYILLAVLLFILWEIFGVYLSGGFKPDWLFDTILDTVCGIVGIIIGHWLMQRLEQLS